MSRFKSRSRFAPGSLLAYDDLIPKDSFSPLLCHSLTPLLFIRMPPKTRGMTQLSAVNKAKTRKGKEKASTNLRLDAMALPVPQKTRSRKKDAVEPLGSSMLHLLPAQTVAEEQPSFPASPEANTHPSHDVLKQGWSLLSQYFDNEAGVSADVVHDFLESIQDVAMKAVLQKGFADITGCEPDDVDEQERIDLMLKAKILELEDVEGIHLLLWLVSNNSHQTCRRRRRCRPNR